MNKTILIVGTILAALAIFIGGLFFGQVFAQTGPSGWMMNGTANGIQAGYMMENNPYGPGMMSSPGMMNGQYGNVMGDGQYCAGMMGMMTGFSGLTAD